MERGKGRREIWRDGQRDAEIVHMYVNHIPDMGLHYMRTHISVGIHHQPFSMIFILSHQNKLVYFINRINVHPKCTTCSSHFSTFSPVTGDNHYPDI